jgi:hypothetical protein
MVRRGMIVRRDDDFIPALPFLASRLNATRIKHVQRDRAPGGGVGARGSLQVSGGAGR